MKKLFIFFLILAVFTSVFSGCDLLPEQVTDIIDSVINKINPDNPADLPGILNPDPDQGGDQNPDQGGDQNPDQGGNTTHEHNFTLKTTIAATCSTPEIAYYACSCGEEKTEVISPAKEHEYEFVSDSATCEDSGKIKYKCKWCTDSYEEDSSAKGHRFEENAEASRISVCLNDGCSYASFGEGDGKYKDVLVFKFTDADIERIGAIRMELKTLVEEADAYDPSLHGYRETGSLADKYSELESLYTETENELLYVVEQYQIAEIYYYEEMGNLKNETNYYDMFDYYNEFYSEFYSYAEPIYNSMYREFYYYGMTEDEIQAYIKDCNGVSTPEYLEISDKISEIEETYFGLEDAGESELTPELYARFVQYKNQLAVILGYDNYLQYAYAVEYSRDYSYEDVALIADYTKQYLVYCFDELYYLYYDLAYSMSDEDYYFFYDLMAGSFFENVIPNQYLNDFIDTLFFGNEENGRITFSDELNKLVSDGNLFRGSYEGAFTTYISNLGIPVAYFGTGYDGAFTVAHEFGHYMNEIYNNGMYVQSYDLLEMHSQGTELMFLSYLGTVMEGDVYDLIEYYTLLNTLNTVLSGLSVDAFERAVYLGEYDGYGYEEIMADGKITYDEYDLLYTYICIDFGLIYEPEAGETLEYDTYWRYVTIPSPCYYVSYSVSALSVLGLYAQSETMSYEKATEIYTRLFTYTDEDPYMTTEQVLEYADLASYNDEELYVLIANTFGM